MSDEEQRAAAQTAMEMITPGMAGKDIFGQAFHERAANPPDPGRWYRFRCWLGARTYDLAEWLHSIAWRIEPW